MRSYKISSTTINEKLYKNSGKAMTSLNRKQMNMVNSLFNKNKEFELNKIPEKKISYNKKIIPKPYNKNDNEYKPMNFNKKNILDYRNDDKMKKEIHPNYAINIDNTSNNKRKNVIETKKYEKSIIIDKIPNRITNTEFKTINTEPAVNSNHARYVRRNIALNQSEKNPKDNIKNNNYYQTGKISNYNKDNYKYNFSDRKE